MLSGLFVALTLSCYKDLSTEATQSLPDIEITSEFERLDVFYGETLTFTPEVRIKGRHWMRSDPIHGLHLSFWLSLNDAASLPL